VSLSHSISVAYGNQIFEGRILEILLAHLFTEKVEMTVSIYHGVK